MAKVHLIGVQWLDFPSKKDGKQVTGINLHVTYVDDNVHGLKADTKFISKFMCENLGLAPEDLYPFEGQDIELELNLAGKVCGVSVLEAKKE